jgi:hypothetical protein
MTMLLLLGIAAASVGCQCSNHWLAALLLHDITAMLAAHLMRQAELVQAQVLQQQR